LLLQLSLATLLVTSSAMADMSLQDFMKDPQIQSLAPNLLQEIEAQGMESFSKDDSQQDLSKFTAGLKLPLLDDIVQVVSLNVFYGGDADWSRLEQAKLKAIQEHGQDALTAAANLTEIDTRRAALIVNTIYDTVVNLPAPSKESYAAKKIAAKIQQDEKMPDAAKEPGEKGTEEKEDTAKDQESEKQQQQQQGGGGASPIWDILGFGLIKSSNTVRKAKGIVSPSNVCETTDTAYLKGVDDVVYYSSLTHGLAGGALAAAPIDSTVKSLDLKTIVHAIGKLAIEIQMAQSVARLADLDPADPQVRAITLLALTSETASSPQAQVARDINNLMNEGIADEIPASVMHSFVDQAARQLITRGAGSSGAGAAPAVFNNIPVVRNFFAFSSEVLSANNIGDVLKYVFCPESSQVTEPPKAEVAAEDMKEGVKDAADMGTEAGQKVFRVSQEAADNVAQGIKDVKDDALKMAAEVGAKVQNKVTEGTEKVNDAGEKIVQDVKDAASDANMKAEEAAAAAKKKAEEMQDSAKEQAKNVADKVEQKADEIKQEL
ncbi:hypothetical protein BGZ98_003692, partial [Dissophora globulifera]